ncbi:hypothetical protein C0995_012746 [Termitomyces sp. Mi166|nr:hypothetical protein C0995_012746 [Termitomyces sp. Mi166\
MPQVFVVPPEEDDTPAWCCFDASASTLNTDFPHHVLGPLQEELLHCNIQEPRSSVDTIPVPKGTGETRSIIDVLLNDDYMGLDDEMGLDLYDELDLDSKEIEQDHLETNVGNDSEVVEVVKIGRYAADVEEHFRTSTPPLRTSKSLKSRASGVFKSLKIAGKGPLRSRSTAQVVLSPSNEEGRAKTPMSYCSSAAFSHHFSPPTTLQSSPSVSSFDLVEVSQIPLKDPSSLRSVSPLSAQPSPLPEPLTSSSTSSLNFREPPRTTSTQTTSNRRHFSMMTLNRIFSFSRSDDVVPVSRPRSSSGPSTGSSPEPETPSEESAPLTPRHIPPPGRKRLPPDDSSSFEEGDISFEMRLDSLHFDSLSFDVDRF